MSDNAKFDEAVLWLSKQARPDFEWDAFTAWLETDAANRAAFDEASLIDDSLDRTLHLLEDAKLAANDNRRSWLGWVGGLGAAAAAAGIFLISPPGGHYPGATPVTSYVTKAGETRTVSLPNRVQVIIAPKSRLDVVGDHLTIDGEGYFAVTHIPARKLIVTAGAITISDIGTIFTADTGHGAPRVSVAEGKLAVTAGGDNRTLEAGQSATLNRGRLAVATAGPGKIGDWRDGSLTFENAPLSLVAQQLNRYSTERVSVDASIANRRFTGVVAIGGNAEPGEAVAAVMGIDARRDGSRVRLVPPR